ncbi:MAG: signal peptidase II [Bacilli bacterium]|nr:signal peptidase II [Bacilli bacterium]
MNKEKVILGLKWFLNSFIWLGVLLFVLDIATKWGIQNTFVNEIWIIPNFLSINLSHNMGAAWSMGGDGNIGMRALWIIISVVLSGALIAFYVIKRNKLSNWYKAALIMMIAGALGNMIDRIFYWKEIVGFDGVIDWISFTFGSYKFPTFNIADSSLVIGVIILIVLIIIEMVQDSIKQGKKGAYKLKPEEYEKKIKEEAEKAKNEEHKD